MNFTGTPKTEHRPPKTKNRNAGFTIIEVVVALTVLSLIILATLTAVRTLGDTQARLESTLVRLDQMRMVNQFLRSTLRQAVPVNAADPAVFSQQGAFQGTAGEVVLVAPMPAIEGGAGLQYMRLFLGDEGEIGIQFSPYRAGYAAPDWMSVTAYPLVDEVELFELEYRETLDGEWLPGWGTETPILPQALKLRIKARDRFWPDLVVSLDQFGGAGGGW